MNKVFGIVGWKNSGKTTLVSALVREFTNRGLCVSTIKNSHHSFSIDVPGTDSFGHREAGAHEVALVSSKRWALMHELHTDGAMPSLETMIAKMAPCDLILVEGFKSSSIQKIETFRSDASSEPPLWQTHDRIVALAADSPHEGCNLPQFALDDIVNIADFIAQISGLRF
ncbi:MAG: molybdopterin-guanine dinucleotide biosynthesis protein B [Rhizobiaceae bacterium]